MPCLYIPIIVNFRLPATSPADNSSLLFLLEGMISRDFIALWYALMAVNNKTGWISDFTVSLAALELKTGMNKTEICKARARLESEHRIKWAKRGGTSCTVYTLLAFEKQVNCKTTGESNGNINKLNKTKHKQNKTINSNDNKLSFVINKIDDANSNFKISKRKSGFDLKKENFEALPDAKHNPTHNSKNEIQILTGGARLKLIAGGGELKVDSLEHITIVSHNDSSAIFLRWFNGAVPINNHCVTV